MDIRIQAFSGEKLRPLIPDLARLRIEVFREFPYLYEGSQAYEEEYLQTYLQSERSVVVLALDSETVIGASTALPLAHEPENVQKPFLEKGMDIERVFYYGESVLNKDYRGRGIGVRFFEEREQWARSFGDYDLASFCAVIRPESHPRRPKSYQPLDAFWQKRGFSRAEGMVCEMSWQDLDESEESPKGLQFWIKSLK